MVERTRTLGFGVAFAIGLGTMIAAGIFSLSGTAVAEIGSSAVISFVIAALVAAITAASYSEFASIYSESGGGYLFTSRTLDKDWIVYTEGVMLFLGYSATTAFYLATMGEWVHQFIADIPVWATASGTALLLGALNARGTKESGLFQVLVTSAKVGVLFAFIGGAAAYRPVAESTGTFLASFSTDLVGILRIASLAFITFFGFSAIAASAGEIKKPRSTVPKAIAASIVTVTILYTLVIVAMVNSPVPAEIVAEQGETAMGKVAAAFLGPWGFKLIVAGAIFSMVSASNASILAASRIGFLMGREGNAVRRFQTINPKFGTPTVAVGACTFTIVSLAVIFTGVFPAHGDALAGLHLGLPALTGFANVNLLVPLSVVNVALIVSRLRSPDMERPFRVPASPLLPALGIAANLALIVSLPFNGIVSGFAGILVFLVVYAAWGGGLAVEEFTEGVSTGGTREPPEIREPDEDVFRVLVPVAREEDAEGLARLADRLGQLQDRPTRIELVHVQSVPEQVPTESVDRTAAESWADSVEERVGDLELEGDVSVRAFVSLDVAFSILELAREEGADLMLMGYPTRHRTIVEELQRKAPCDVMYASGARADLDLSRVNVGAGGGPHHEAALGIVDRMSEQGTDVHVIRVDPEVEGTPEQVEMTVEGLEHAETLQIHNVRDRNVARGLVRQARDNGGVLLLGSSRDSLLKQWLLGSTPDQVVDLAEHAGVPVLVYQGNPERRSRVGDAAFTVYRVVRNWFR